LPNYQLLPYPYKITYLLPSSFFLLPSRSSSLRGSFNPYSFHGKGVPIFQNYLFCSQRKINVSIASILITNQLNYVVILAASKREQGIGTPEQEKLMFLNMRLK